MPDPDPPDEVDDGKAPTNRNIDTPYANSAYKQSSHGVEEQHDQGKGHRQTD
jgi:hypothetical protein